MRPHADRGRLVEKLLLEDEENAEKVPLTAIIPAGNEAMMIEDAVRSVLWAAEVLVVVDAAATDETAQKAGRIDPGVRVLTHEYAYSAAQKNWAIPRANFPYVFLLDADERVTPKLQAEIRALFKNTPAFDVYWINRKNVIFNRVMRYGGQQTDKVIRLFRRECRYQDRRVHAEIEDQRRAGRLRFPILHDTFRGWNHYLAKLDRYTTWGAEQDFKDGKNSTWTQIVLRPMGRFLKQYVIRLGFLDGIPGAISAFFGVYGVFLKYAKLWDLGRRRKQ